MRLRILPACLAAAVLATAAPASGQGETFDDRPPPPPVLTEVPAAPEPPEPVRSGESLEPDVRIIRGEDKVITEYRVNGRVRAVKVEPDGAPTYYLVDYDGDGDFERSSSFEPGYVSQWILFSW